MRRCKVDSVHPQTIARYIIANPLKALVPATKRWAFSLKTEKYVGRKPRQNQVKHEKWAKQMPFIHITIAVGFAETGKPRASHSNGRNMQISYKIVWNWKKYATKANLSLLRTCFYRDLHSVSMVNHEGPPPRIFTYMQSRRPTRISLHSYTLKHPCKFLARLINNIEMCI